MSEIAEKIQARRSPLHEVFEKLELNFIVVDGLLTPTDFGDTLREYRAVREAGAGLLDLSARARFRVTGTEAILFLNGLITNDMKVLAENEWMPALFPNVQGRLIASVRVLRLPDTTAEKDGVPVFLLDTEAATHDQVFQTISRFTLAGDFKVEDLTELTTCISIQGKAAKSIVQRTSGIASPLEANQLRRIKWNDSELILVHCTHTSEDGYDIFVDASAAADLWDRLLLEGAQPTGSNTFEVLRIEAGIPRFGVDMNDEMVVSETNLDDAISFTKGCYIGQEIVARIKYRGHVAKKITGVVFDSSAEAGEKLSAADGKEVGVITSVTFSPTLGKWSALAVVRYQYLSPGTEVSIERGPENVRGVVTELPFIKGSWTN